MTQEPAYRAPHVDAAPGRIAVGWETESVEFAFERFRTDRRSAELTAELSVWDTVSGTQITGGLRVNLTSGRARTEVANSLGKRLQRERQDWPELVEHSFRLARERTRQGEPSILLRDAPERDARYALEPLFTEAGGTVIFGDGGTFKSLLVLAAGIDLHRGTGEILGLEPAQAMRVLFLDWEWDASVHRERMHSLVGSDMPDLAYLRCEAPIADELERIQGSIRRHKSEFLLIDSVAWAAGDDPETSNSAKGFYTATRQLGLPFAALAHQPKAGDPSKPFGSVFWHNGARLTWQQSSERNIGETTARIGLVNRKQNDDGPSPAPMGWEMSKVDGRTVFRRVNAASIDSVASKLPVREQALAALHGNPTARTYHELAEELDVQVGTLRRTIDRDMTSRGMRSPFVKVAGTDNVYRIGLRSRLEEVA